MSCATLIEIILAILIAPVAVFLVAGCGIDLLINILLCFLGYVPACIHALYLIAVKNRRTNSNAAN
ncbi:hypothetical protein NEMIN01_0678 [Nematocida minor]|uniref:uncharacterized protein n=1 Tax=Nematocida minor TaxID=1912983 RepID=UPI00221FB386|nr:uncharacterized protein NEMIN01_0678 [Nematocida minor]KAI5189815.1 hypothetical protein NEMIN01_0678 [Nematocida minor]